MLSAVAVCGQRWQIAPDIVWKVGSDIPHDDHIEMSGERMAFVLRWGVDSRGAFRQERSLVFPLLRTLPNNTHASLMYRMAADIPSLLGVNGLALQDERVGQAEPLGRGQDERRFGARHETRARRGDDAYDLPFAHAAAHVRALHAA